MPSDKIKYLQDVESIFYYKRRIIEQLKSIYEIYKKSRIFDLQLVATNEEKIKAKNFAGKYSHKILSEAQYNLLDYIFSWENPPYKMQNLELERETIHFQIVLENNLCDKYSLNSITAYGNEKEIDNYLFGITQDLKQYCLTLESSIKARRDNKEQEKENRYKQYLKLKKEFEPKENNK